jgi:hypothetical protein
MDADGSELCPVVRFNACDVEPFFGLCNHSIFE